MNCFSPFLSIDLFYSLRCQSHFCTFSFRILLAFNSTNAKTLLIQPKNICSSKNDYRGPNDPDLNRGERHSFQSTRRGQVQDGPVLCQAPFWQRFEQWLGIWGVGTSWAARFWWPSTRVEHRLQVRVLPCLLPCHLCNTKFYILFHFQI